MCSFGTNFNKFLFARNLDYWFFGTSFFVYIDMSDGDSGCSLFSDRSFIIVGKCLSALVYTVFVLYHDYTEMVSVLYSFSYNF